MRAIWMSSLLASALLACKADSPPSDRNCEGTVTRDCMCGELGGQETCVGGRYGECVCASMAPDAGSTDANFGNASRDANFPDFDLDAMAVGDEDAALTEESACAQQESAAVLPVERAVDIIFVIDNSGSMSNEIAAVESNINENFAKIIEDSGVDYRVIMLTSHGDSSTYVCIAEPLSGTTCVPAPAQPVNTARFYHYDFNVQSWDTWCRILETFDTPDMHNFAPNGWSEWLREDSLKAFVAITDDTANCNTARGNFSVPNTGDVVADAAEKAFAFKDALLALSPDHFGDKTNPKYVWYSIIGMIENDPKEAAWLPQQPVVSQRCSTAPSPGEPYQMLSIATNALRYPVCEGTGFDAVFSALAGGVIEGAQADCQFAVPDPPEDKFIDLDSIVINYDPGGGGPTQKMHRVAEKDCDDESFFVRVAQKKLKLCPEACDVVRADGEAKLQVLFACGEDDPFVPMTVE